ncbi:MAG: hypothetical protein JWO58_905 [Chitinophagaceae bacterium]|nr:hypothetical protein [Chitinophagaceae bacterium]
MLHIVRIFILVLIFCLATPGFSQEVDTIALHPEEEGPLMEEQVQQEELGIVYGKDSIKGKALDSTTWKALTKELTYGDTLATEKKETASKSINFNPFFSINSTLTKYILFTLVITALLYLLYRLIGSAIIAGDTKITKAQATFEILHDDEQMMQKDLQALLDEALRNEDYKSAIRILFIQSLQDLQASDRIKWKKEKTNRDYLQELSTTHSFVPFGSMVSLYEKAWYSKFNTTKEDLDAFYPFQAALHSN